MVPRIIIISFLCIIAYVRIARGTIWRFPLISVSDKEPKDLIFHGDEHSKHTLSDAPLVSVPKKKLKGNYNQSVSRFDAKSNEAVSVNSYSLYVFVPFFFFLFLFFSNIISFYFVYRIIEYIFRNTHIIHAGTRKQDDEMCDNSGSYIFWISRLNIVNVSKGMYFLFFLIFRNVWIRLVKELG